MTTVSGYRKENILNEALMFAFLVAATLLPSHTTIEAQQVSLRPKIGLALSGGGANGLAHIGVLKVMEEAGLKPDYISGVSMGSIIGAMYSIGYSSDSLYKIIKLMDWDLSFDAIIPENKVIFPEKEHYNNSIISLPISSKKVKLPSGLINGQQVENLISYYFWPAATINDFSRLPIPFTCLATDILKGKIVELKSGYLPDAIRASIAVPTIFTPIRIDSAILIDGGVLRNYDAEQVRKMGADFVIGSYTGFQFYSEDQLESLPGIVKQIAFLRSYEDFQVQKKFTNILIEPYLKGYSPAVFTNADSVIQKGYNAALPYRDYFKRLADSLNRIQSPVPPEYILDRQSLIFDKVEVTGNKIYSDNQILGILGIEPGQNVDKNFLTEKIDLLYGKTWFNKIKYRIIPRNDSLILDIDCIEQPNSMLFGGLYYDSYIRSGVVFRGTFKDLLTARSLIDFDSFIGQFYRAKLSLLQYIDRNQKLGFSTSFHAENTLLPMLNIRNEPGGAFNRIFNTSFSISKYLGLNHLMNISLNIESNSFIPDFVSLNNLKKVTYNVLSASYNYEVNTLDTKSFPHRGALFHLSAGTSKLISGVVISNNFRNTYNDVSPGEFSFKRTYSFNAGFRNYSPLGKKIIMSFKGNLLYTTDHDSTPSLNNLYFLGGVDALSRRSVAGIGFRSNEIAVTRLAGIGTGLDIEIVKDLHLTLAANLFAVKEIHDNFSFLGGYGVGLGYMTIIGPIRIGLMHGLSISERSFSAIKGYVSLGYSF